jgi:anti-anti-sigma regulatory factor
VTWEFWLSSDADEMVVSLKGSLTFESVSRVERLLAGEISAAEGRQVRVVLSEVTSIDWAGLDMLRRCRVRARRLGTRVAIRDLSLPVRRCLRQPYPLDVYPANVERLERPRRGSTRPSR